MSIDKQYSTMGITGFYECLEILGLNILEKEGQDFALQILDLLNNKISDANKKYKSPHGQLCGI